VIKKEKKMLRAIQSQVDVTNNQSKRGEYVADQPLPDIHKSLTPISPDKYEVNLP